MTSDSSAPPAHKPRPLLDLLVSIVIPAVILMQFSGEADLGAARALLLALVFPIGWGLFELLQYRKFNFIALPATLMRVAVLYYLARPGRQLAGLKLTDILNQTGDRP